MPKCRSKLWLCVAAFAASAACHSAQVPAGQNEGPSGATPSAPSSADSGENSTPEETPDSSLSDRADAAQSGAPDAGTPMRDAMAMPSGAPGLDEAIFSADFPSPDEPRARRSDDCKIASGPGEITTLMQAGANVGHVFVSDAFVYFVNESVCRNPKPRMPITPDCEVFGPLQRFPRCGGDIETLIDDVSSPRKFAAGGGYVYLAGRKLLRIQESDKAIETLGADPGCIADLAANDQHLYAYDTCKREIVRTAHGRSTFERFAPAADKGALAIGRHVVYFECGADVCFRDGRSGEAGKFAHGSAKALVALAVTDDAVYVAHHVVVAPPVDGVSTSEFQDKLADIHRIPLDRAPRTIVGRMQWFEQTTRVGDELSGLVPTASGLGSIFPVNDLHVEGERLYFRDLTRNGAPQISSIGAGAQLQSAMPRSYTALAAFGDRLYWSEFGALYSARVVPPRAASPAPQLAVSSQRTGLLLGVADFRGEGVVGFDGGWDPGTLSLVRLDAAGKQLWKTAVPVDSGGTLTPTHCVAVDSRGVVTAVAGQSAGTASSVLILRWDADGKLLSTVREPYAVAGARCAARADDSVVMWLGGTLFVARDAAGNELWRRGEAYGADGMARGLELSELRATPAGVVIVGQGFGGLAWGGQNFGIGATESSSFVAQLDDSGNPKWLRLTRGGRALSATALPDGRIVVSGVTPGSIDVGMGPQEVARPRERFTFLVWLRADGSVDALRLYDLPSASSGGGTLASDARGGLWLVGDSALRPLHMEPETAPGSSESGVTLLELDATGAFQRAYNLTTLLANGAGDQLNFYGSLVPQGNRLWISGAFTQNIYARSVPSDADYARWQTGYVVSVEP